MNARLGLLLAVSALTGLTGLTGLAACAAKTGQNAVTPAPSPTVTVVSSSAEAPPGPPATASPSRSAAPPPSDEPTISLPPGLPKTTGAQPPVDAFQELTVQGKVRVVGSCVQLVTDKLAWLLIGPAVAGLRDGQQVKVAGVPDPNHESACSGSPLLVARVTPL